MKVIVIGSGPAGVSAAKGLLDHGCKVTLLDAGLTLEADKQRLLNEIRSGKQPHSIESIRHKANGKDNLKLPYGSNYIYSSADEFFSWQTENVYFNPSFARGGLSNVWGGATAEYSCDELFDWPISCRDLSSYYRIITAWMSPHYTRDTSTILSNQAQRLKAILLKNKITLNNRGIYFDSPSLAIDSNKCQLCGSCQYGCPYEFIYHSGMHLTSLMKESNFSYISNIAVERFYEYQGKAFVLFKNISTRNINKISADRLYVACGSGISSLLYLRSFEKYNTKIYLKDSQHFILPCIMDKPSERVTKDRLHTLCQLKINMIQNDLSKYPIHLQIYTYMDLYYHEIKRRLGFLSTLSQPIIQFFLNRLIVIQGYLNSLESNQIEISQDYSGNFNIKNDVTCDTNTIITNVTNTISRNSKYLGFKPIKYLRHTSMTGKSNHIGGSIPMSEKPNDHEVDIFGRPKSIERIHFVDGSILPSLPAGPITLTIMANAYRIAKESLI